MDVQSKAAAPGSVQNMDSWKQKLHPQRFPNMSPRMAALVGYFCDEVYTDPSISELLVTSDQYVLAGHSDEIGANHFIGPVSVLKENWTRLLDTAELTAEERQQAEAAFSSKVYIVP